MGKYINNFSPLPFPTELVSSLAEIINCLETNFLKCTRWWLSTTILYYKLKFAIILFVLNIQNKIMWYDKDISKQYGSNHLAIHKCIKPKCCTPQTYIMSIFFQLKIFLKTVSQHDQSLKNSHTFDLIVLKGLIPNKKKKLTF